MILIGAIGGLLAHGLIGLFVGPIVFSLGFRLFQAWVHPPCRRTGRSAVDRDLGHGEVGIERAADGDQPQAAQGCRRQRRVDAVRA